MWCHYSIVQFSGLWVITTVQHTVNEAAPWGSDTLQEQWRMRYHWAAAQRQTSRHEVQSPLRTCAEYHVFSTKLRSHQASGPLALPCTDEFAVSGTMASEELGELIMKFISGKKKKIWVMIQGFRGALAPEQMPQNFKAYAPKAIFRPEAFLHWYTDKTDGCCPVGKDARGTEGQAGRGAVSDAWW